MKVCSRCKKKKQTSSFSKNRRRKDGLQTYCRECVKDANKAAYERDPDHHIERAKQRRARLRKIARDYVYEYWKEHPCIDCGQANPMTLQFDHVRGEKALPVSKMVAASNLLETLKAEIDKCEVRCASCHEIRTWTGKSWVWRRMQQENN